MQHTTCEFIIIVLKDLVIIESKPYGYPEEGDLKVPTY